MKSAICVAAMMVLVVSSVGNGVPYDLDGTWVEVDDWVGSGPNETIVVVDWNGTNGPYVTESHAWGYRWSGSEFLVDALDAICLATALDMTTAYGGGFVDHLYYDDGTDNHTSVDYGGWWWLGSTVDGGATWEANGNPITGESLVDGQIEGLNLDFKLWTSDSLTIPTPEPAGGLLLIVAGLVGLRRRPAA